MPKSGLFQKLQSQQKSPTYFLYLDLKFTRALLFFSRPGKLQTKLSIINHRSQMQSVTRILSITMCVYFLRKRFY